MTEKLESVEKTKGDVLRRKEPIPTAPGLWLHGGPQEGSPGEERLAVFPSGLGETG